MMKEYKFKAFSLDTARSSSGRSYVSCISFFKLGVVLIILALLNAQTAAKPEGGYMSLEETLQAGQSWISRNVEPEIANQIDSIDKQQLNTILRRIQTALQGDYIIDLARLKPYAELALSLMENVDAAKPYAAWLRPRMDYFEVAEQLEVHIPPPRSRDQNAHRRPSRKLQRRIWEQQVESKTAPQNAKYYESRLKPVFEAQGLPEELIWLAEVESSFNPAARSPAGAVGLFQFMPATARQYGLSLNPEDERLDAMKSADAAARYLDCLHERFASWPLALASYNAGEGRVARLLKKRNAASFAEIADGLPAETRMYVPKVEATILQREGVRLFRL